MINHTPMKNEYLKWKESIDEYHKRIAEQQANIQESNKDVLTEFVLSQETLGRDFENVLNENRWDLYES